MKSFMLAGALAAIAFASAPAHAVAIREAAQFTTVLAPNDDGFVGPVAIGFDVNFVGATFSDLFVNNNGNVTFDSGLSTFTPFNLLTTGRSIIAPFFADVDTRAAGSDVVRYGQGTVDGRSAFGVNWIDVGYFASQDRHLNSFQLILTDRSDINAGDFDIEFNYDTITWETGQASGGDIEGLGGNSARAGFSNGVDFAFELEGSAINGAFLDGGPNALISDSLNSDVLGRYIFRVRNGRIIDVPAPAALSLFGLGALALVASRRKA